jgi:hypothetical protein
VAQPPGRQWEKLLAARIGGREQPSSGSKWYAKLDVRGRKTIWSAKDTEAESFRITRDMLREIRSSVNTPGAPSGLIPIMGIRIAGKEEVAVLMLDDLLSLLASDESTPVAPTKAEAIQHRASLPQLLRDA